MRHQRFGTFAVGVLMAVVVTAAGLAVTGAPAVADDPPGGPYSCVAVPGDYSTLDGYPDNPRSHTYYLAAAYRTFYTYHRYWHVEEWTPATGTQYAGTFLVTCVDDRWESTVAVAPTRFAGDRLCGAHTTVYAKGGADIRYVWQSDHDDPIGSDWYRFSYWRVEQRWLDTNIWDPLRVVIAQC